MLGILYTVIFSPYDIYLIKGEPGGRRKFLDTLLAQISPVYLSALQHYRKVLKEKSALLKYEHVDNTLLNTYNCQQARFGSKLIVFRNALLEKLNCEADIIYRKFTNGQDTLSIDYKSFCEIDNLRDENAVYDEFINRLEKKEHIEKKRKICLVGPHLDDMVLYINAKSAKSFASEGQKRAIALSLRIAEYEIVKSILKEPPVVLLDDVFGELDPDKKKILNNMFDADIQLFVTCTDYRDVGGLLENARRFCVSNGKIYEKKKT